MLTQTDQNACSRNLNNEIQKKQVIWQPEKILDVYSVFMWTSYGVFIVKKFPRWLSGKEITCQSRRHAGGMSWIPGMGRSPEEEVATYSNLLSWRIQWTHEMGRLQSTGLQRVGHDLATEHAHTHTNTHTHTHTYTHFILKLGTQSKINRSLFLRIPDLC